MIFFVFLIAEEYKGNSLKIGVSHATLFVLEIPIHFRTFYSNNMYNKCIAFLQMTQNLVSNGANLLWEHSLLDSTQTKGGIRKPNPKDPVQ